MWSRPMLLHGVSVLILWVGIFLRLVLKPVCDGVSPGFSFMSSSLCSGVGFSDGGVERTAAISANMEDPKDLTVLFRPHAHLSQLLVSSPLFPCLSAAAAARCGLRDPPPPPHDAAAAALLFRTTRLGAGPSLLPEAAGGSLLFASRATRSTAAPWSSSRGPRRPNPQQPTGSSACG